MAHRKGLFLSAALIALTLSAMPAAADPWARSGDLALRHDLRLLADAGVITSPANTWPIPWATISADLGASRSADLDDPAVAAARARMQARISRVQGLKGLQPNARLGARTDEFWLRTFEDTPRDQGEARIGGSWMGDRFAARLQISYAHDPLPDDQEWRADGSYIAGTFGNHIVSVGAIDRWWGPSANDSLILSSNARPVAGVALERSTAKAFETKWLSWIGPWRYTLLWGALGNDTEPEDAQLVAFRVDVRPLEALEIGLTRSAQWCGNDRPCDGDTFVDLVLGRDNVGSSGIDDSNEPGNQLAAVDLRWQAPLIDGPWALYGQVVGEDEAGGLPSKTFGQGGLEFWGSVDSTLISGSWRAHAEYTNTTVRFLGSDPEHNVAYEHGTYTTGYRFEQRALGAAADGDSELVSLGLLLVDDQAHSWNGLVRFGTINEKGAAKGRDARHTVSPDELEIVGAQFTHKRAIGRGDLDLGAVSVGVGVQYSDNQVTGVSDTDAQAFVTWTWDYSGL
jgi:hypothetical protein